MITKLLENLSSIFTRIFVLGIVPILLFLLLHGLVASSQVKGASEWIDKYLKPEFSDPGFATAIAALLLITLAYVWNSLSAVFREALEGKKFSKDVAANLALRFTDELEGIETGIATAKLQLAQIQQAEAGWSAEMKTKRLAGDTAHSGSAFTYQQPAPVAAVMRSWRSQQKLEFADLQAAVAALCAVLSAHSAGRMKQGDREAAQLDADQTKLRAAISYARARWAAELGELLRKKEFDLAGGALQPTTIGNIAESTAHYAQSRYGFDLEVFWPRLQALVSKEEKDVAALVEANTRLDFVITLLLQSGIFTATWVILLPIFGESLLLFAVIAAGGVASCYLWYVVVRQQYRELSSTMRSVIDLHRHALLEQLKMPVPTSTNHERRIWAALEEHIGNGGIQTLTFSGKAQS